MRFRFVQVLALLCVLAGAYAGVARALDFDDEDPEPPHPEVGLIYHYEIGTHAGCLPHHLSVGQGQLPPGLQLTQLNDHTGLVSGVATDPGVYSAWIYLKDCANKTAETLFTFEVFVRRWGIATTSLPTAATGSPYSFKLAGTGIPSTVTWEVTTGALPAGLTLAQDGTISGTPTGSGSSTFMVKGTAQSTDPSSPGTRIDSRQLTLNVTGQLSAALSRPVAEVGVPVRSSLVATGGTAPYTWSLKSVLPPGLALGSDGSISGVPNRTGAVTLTAHVVDVNGSAKDVVVRLVVRPRLAVATKFLPAATAGHAYRAKLKIRGGAGGLQWSVRGAPAGLRLDAATGQLSGSPSVAGTFRFTVRVRDVLGAVSVKTLVLNVH
jgi:putative Ig domain-containing protein